MKKRLFILFVLVTACTFAVAATTPLRFKHVTVKDGLLSGNVYSVCQGGDGCIWIATAGGLCMYNGSDVRSYEIEDLYVRDADDAREWLYADGAGNVWVSYDNLSFYDKVTDSVRRVEWFPDAVVTDFIEVGDVLYVATNSGTVAVNIRTFSPCRVPDSFRSLPPLKFCRKGKNIVVYTRDGRIAYYDIGSDNVLSVRPCSLPAKVTDIDCDKDGNIWVATNGEGLYCVDENDVPVGYTIASGLVNSNYIRSISFDNDSMLWVGTGNGLSIVDTHRKQSHHVLYSRNAPNGISNNSITGVYRSLDGGMWLSNMGHGVDYYYKENSHFDDVELKDIQEVVIGGMAEDKDGSIWIGTSRYGAFHLFPDTGRMSHVLLSDDPVKNDIKNIAFSEDGRKVYFCTARYGLNVYDRASKRIDNYSSAAYPGTVSSLIAENDRFLWVGTPDGISLFDLQLKTASVLSSDSISSVYCMYRDSAGYCWLGTESALVKCRLAVSSLNTPQISNVVAYTNLTKVQDIYEYGGNIYVATMHGLYVSSSSDEWRLYTKEDGLPSDCLYCLESDEHKRIWIGTENGLSCFDTVSGRFTNFYAQNGLSCSVFRKGASIATRSGLIYMGGFDGLVRFNPSDISNSRYSWCPMVSDIVSDGEHIRPDKDGKVVLKPGQRSISLTFAQPGYTSSGKGSFAFRLLPEYKEWNKSIQRSVYLSDLSVGHHTLELTADDEKEPSSECEKYSIEIIVEPRWYETTTAILMLCLFFIGIVAYIFWASLSKEKKRNKVEIEKIKQKSKAALNYRQARFYAKDILSAEDSKFLNKVISIVEHNLQNNDFTVETLSSDMCTCRSNLYRRIMSITGDTVQNLIKKVRLENAIQLMEDNRYTISQVSEMVGFSSTSYFVTCFREYTGRTPGEMKKNVS